jgi:hypothetical protein
MLALSRPAAPPDASGDPEHSLRPHSPWHAKVKTGTDPATPVVSNSCAASGTFAPATDATLLRGLSRRLQGGGAFCYRLGICIHGQVERFAEEPAKD